MLPIRTFCYKYFTLAHIIGLYARTAKFYVKWLFTAQREIKWFLVKNEKGKYRSYLKHLILVNTDSSIENHENLLCT